MRNTLNAELNDIADQLVGIRGQGTRNDLLLQRFKRRAEALILQAPAKSHNVLGMIAAIRRDEGRMRDHFRIALANDPWDPAVRINQVSCLQDFAALSEAARVARQNSADLPRNPDLMRQAVEAGVFAGRLREARTLLRRLEALGLIEAVDGATSLMACAQFMEERGLEDQALEAHQRHAADLLRNADCPVPQVRLTLEEKAGRAWRVELALMVPREQSEVDILGQRLREKGREATSHKRDGQLVVEFMVYRPATLAE